MSDFQVIHVKTRAEAPAAEPDFVVTGGSEDVVRICRADYDSLPEWRYITLLAGERTWLVWQVPLLETETMEAGVVEVDHALACTALTAVISLGALLETEARLGGGDESTRMAITMQETVETLTSAIVRAKAGQVHVGFDERLEAVEARCAMLQRQRDEALALVAEGRRLGVPDLPAQLGEVMGLLQAAESSLSVDDYGDAVAGAKRRIAEMLAGLEGGAA